jgi:CelD/BcsL family acetyltransferase involved in cellulose biosynthesis
MQSAQPSSLVVTLSDAPSLVVLEQEWRALEARSDASFFTSWTWIGAWLRALPASMRPQLARVTQDTLLVGLALFTPRRLRRHGFIRSNGLFLHATGDPSYDDITVEYNGILADRRFAPDIGRCVLEHLVSQTPGWDELHMQALAALPDPHAPAGVMAHHTERTSYHVDLNKVRAEGGDYLALLGQKPRYNVRRSLKGCSKHGAVELVVASSTEAASRFLAELKQLHGAYWRSRGAEGAFASPFANAFHDDLVGSGFGQGEIQLLHVRAGDQTVGYLYNFVHAGRVMTYQAGINYALLPPSESPGLATHALAIQFNAAQGHEVYDFMVGDQQYKRALCTDTTTQHWLVLRRDRLKFRIENRLRHLRDRWRQRGQPALPA